MTDGTISPGSIATDDLKIAANAQTDMEGPQNGGVDRALAVIFRGRGKASTRQDAIQYDTVPLIVSIIRTGQ